VTAERIEELRIAWQQRESHHRALWEEEKHFTWLNSIVLAAQTALITSQTLNSSARHLIALILASFGSLFAITAIVVVRAEGRNFQRALGRFLSLYNDTYHERPLPVPLPFLAGPIPFAELAYPLTIRDMFQLVFGLFVLLNVLVGLIIVTGAA
jgi:hypothetical protein